MQRKVNVVEDLDALLVALILMIEKSRDEDKEMIIRTVLNCMR